MATVGQAAVFTEHIRKASLSFVVGKVEFQAKKCVARNPQANSTKRWLEQYSPASPEFSEIGSPSGAFWFC